MSTHNQRKPETVIVLSDSSADSDSVDSQEVGGNDETRFFANLPDEEYSTMPPKLPIIKPYGSRIIAARKVLNSALFWQYNKANRSNIQERTMRVLQKMRQRQKQQAALQTVTVIPGNTQKNNTSTHSDISANEYIQNNEMMETEAVEEEEEEEEEKETAEIEKEEECYDFNFMGFFEQQARAESHLEESELEEQNEEVEDLEDQDSDHSSEESGKSASSKESYGSASEDTNTSENSSVSHNKNTNNNNNNNSFDISESDEEKMEVEPHPATQPSQVAFKDNIKPNASEGVNLIMKSLSHQIAGPWPNANVVASPRPPPPVKQENNEENFARLMNPLYQVMNNNNNNNNNETPARASQLAENGSHQAKSMQVVDLSSDEYEEEEEEELEEEDDDEEIITEKAEKTSKPASYDNAVSNLIYGDSSSIASPVKQTTEDVMDDIIPPPKEVLEEIKVEKQPVVVMTSEPQEEMSQKITSSCADITLQQQESILASLFEKQDSSQQCQEILQNLKKELIKIQQQLSEKDKEIMELLRLKHSKLEMQERIERFLSQQEIYNNESWKNSTNVSHHSQLEEIKVKRVGSTQNLLKACVSMNQEQLQEAVNKDDETNLANILNNSHDKRPSRRPAPLLNATSTTSRIEMPIFKKEEFPPLPTTSAAASFNIPAVKQNYEIPRITKNKVELMESSSSSESASESSSTDSDSEETAKHLLKMAKSMAERKMKRRKNHLLKNLKRLINGYERTKPKQSSRSSHSKRRKIPIQMCEFCEIRSAKFACGNCNERFYCTDRCQQLDFPSHVQMC